MTERSYNSLYLSYAILPDAKLDDVPDAADTQDDENYRNFVEKLRVSLIGNAYSIEALDVFEPPTHMQDHLAGIGVDDFIVLDGFEPPTYMKAMMGRVSKILFVMSPKAYASYKCYLELFSAINRKDVDIIPVNWADGDMDAIMALVPAGGWDERYTQAEIKKMITGVRVEVNKKNWVDFSKYAKNFDDNTFAVTYGRLLRAIGEPTETYDLMISYSREEETIVKLYYEGLCDARRKVWLDTRDIVPGKDWFAEIESGIESANNCIFFVSNHWLASEICDKEFRYARENNKSILVVWIENLEINKAYDLAIKRNRWKAPSEKETNDQSDARIKSEKAVLIKTKDAIEAYREPLRLQSNTAIDNKILRQIIEKIDDGKVDKNKHTKLLLLAINHKERNGRLLGFSEWWTYATWVYKNNQQPEPTILQRNYVRNSGRRLARQSLITLLLIISISLSYVVRVVRVEAENLQVREQLVTERLDSQIKLNDALEEQVQTLAQSSGSCFVSVGDSESVACNNSQLISLGDASRPRRPLLVNNDLWVSLAANGEVWRLDLKGNVQARIKTGADPEKPVFDGQYLWVSNLGSHTVSRIDPAVANLGHDEGAVDGGTITYDTVGRMPDTPIVSGQTVWVVSYADRVLTQLKPDNGKTISLHLNDRRVVSGGNSLWIFGRSRLTQVDSRTGETLVIEGFSDITSVNYHNNMLWLVDGTVLHQINPANGESIASVDLGVAIDPPIMTDRNLWAISRSTQSIYRIDRNNLSVNEAISVSSPQKLFLLANRLWLFSSNDTLTILDDETGDEVAMLSITGTGTVDVPVFDGENVWVTPLSQGTSYLIDPDDGKIKRRFQPCSKAQSPVFDGANMWFTCQENDRFVVIPAFLHFFGMRTGITDTYGHSPIIHDGLMWMTQESTGRLLVYDVSDERLVFEHNFNQQILPLVKDNNYFWTALGNSGQVARIDPTLLAQPDDAIVMVDMVSGIYNLTLVKNKMWVLHNAPESGVTFSIIDRETLEITEHQVGLVSSGITVADDVWMTSSNFTEGSVLRLHPETGEVIAEYDIPDTDFVSWAPQWIDGLLWFAAVVPPPASATTVVTMTIGTDEDVPPTYLYAFNPRTETWGQRWELPGLTGAEAQQYRNPQVDMVWDRRTLWYTLIAAPVLTQNFGEGASGIFSIDITTGELSEVRSFCQFFNRFTNSVQEGSSNGVEHVGRFIFSGCLSPSSNFAVLDQSTQQVLYHYDNVGSRPWNPVQVGDYVVYTFRDSDNAAIFDARTGELLRTLIMGDSPTPPVVIGDAVYVYHSGDDTLRRIYPSAVRS